MLNISKDYHSIIERLTEIDFDVQKAKKRMEGQKCTNPDHTDHKNKVVLAEHGGSFKVYACCDEFADTIADILLPYC